MRRRWPVVVALASLLACCVALVYLGLRDRQQTARCPAGLQPSGARCCGVGQSLEGVYCRGAPRRCAAGQRVTRRGCLAVNRQVHVPGGRLIVAANDWEALGKTTPRRVQIRGFWLDSHEVTRARYHQCEHDPPACPERLAEPGLPQTWISPAQAARFCGQRGGRLPTVDEWMYAASALGSSRYPWGATGLVCRRAAFGLARGPCASGARTAELAGARPPGATRQGLFDMSGNVAEWVSGRGAPLAMGGSYRSAVAGELKFWSHRNTSRAAVDVGFRCAYARPASADRLEQSISDAP